MRRRYALGIDTSNYKTSLAVVDDRDNIICDFRKFLTVKQGERGLRQSDALFQHVKNFPQLMKEVRKIFDGQFDIIAYSSRPRPVEGSYMPVFTAGESFAVSMAQALDIPAIAFSHQEGHIEAVKHFSKFKNKERILACHFSGGTCEILKADRNYGRCKTNEDDASGSPCTYKTEIVGKSLDISFGQVIDRAGVFMGCGFPAGAELDQLAGASKKSTSLLTAVKVKDGNLNLSGIDAQIKRMLERYVNADQNSGGKMFDKAEFSREIFEKIADAMWKMIMQSCEKTGINDVLAAGGVSSSRVIRRIIGEKSAREKINLAFDSGNLSEDNAVGTALLGGMKIWD